MTKITTDNLNLIIGDDTGTDTVLPDFQSNWNAINNADKTRQTAIATETSSRIAGDAATLTSAQTYVNGLLQHLALKPPARMLSTTNVNLSSPGSGPFDTVTPIVNDTVLLVGQTAGSQNGPYIFNGPTVPMTRTPETNTSGSMEPGLIIVVQEGSTPNADSIWELTTNAPIVLETTSLTFAMKVGAGLGFALATDLATETSSRIAGDANTLTSANSYADTNKLAKSANLSDVASASTVRTNLGLGDTAVKNTGTTAGTLAAGDDARLSDTRTPSALSIVDAMVASGAAIAKSKLASLAIADADVAAISESKITGLTVDLAAKAAALSVPTEVTTSGTLVANQLLRVSSASASNTQTLPITPADGTLIGVKHTTQGTTAGVPNTVAVSCGGSSHFNTTAGGITFNLSLKAQGVLLEYKASEDIWIIYGDDLPLGQLDVRYIRIAPAPTGDATGVADYNNLVAAAGSGNVKVALSAGTYIINAPLPLKNGLCWEGQGTEATIVTLSTGANCDVFEGDNFATLTNTGAGAWTSGVVGGSISHLTIDGNRTNQTYSGGIINSHAVPSTAPAYGYGIRTYGYKWRFQNLIVRNCLAYGTWTEWGIASSSVTNTSDSLESYMHNVKVHDNGIHGVYHRGPSDPQYSNILCFNNGQAGTTASINFWAESDNTTNGSGTSHFSANGIQMTNVHCWGGTKWNMVLDCNASASNCHVEGNSVGQLLLRGVVSWSGGRDYYISSQNSSYGLGVQLGDAGSTPNVPTSISYTANVFFNGPLSGFIGDTQARAPIYWANANQSCIIAFAGIKTPPTGTINSASNGIDVSTFTSGSPGTIRLNSIGAFPSSGTVTVPTALGNVTCTYTGTTSSGNIGLTGVVASGSPASGSNMSTGGTVTLANVGTVTVSGTVDTGSTCRVSSAGSGVTAATIGGAGYQYQAGRHRGEVGNQSAAFTLTNGGSDALNLNTSSKRLELINGTSLRIYSGNYSGQIFTIDGTTAAIASVGAAVFTVDSGAALKVVKSTGTLDIFNVNTTNATPLAQFVNGASIRGYSDAYTTQTYSIDGATGLATLLKINAHSDDANAFRVQKLTGNADVLNVNASTAQVQIPNAGTLKMWSDAYSTQSILLDGSGGIVTANSFQAKVTSTTALYIQNAGGASTIFNINTSTSRVELPNGTQIRQWSDAYTTATFVLDGSGNVTANSYLVNVSAASVFKAQNGSGVDLVNVNATSTKQLQLVNATGLKGYSDAYSTQTFLIDGTGAGTFASLTTTGTVAFSGTSTFTGITKVAIDSTGGFAVKSITGNLDILNINTTSKRIDVPNGTAIKGYSDAYSTQTFLIDGNAGTLALTSANTSALKVSTATADVFRVSASGLIVALPNASQLIQYSDAYTTTTFKVDATGNITGLSLAVTGASSVKVTSGTAFTVKNGSNSDFLNINTTNSRVELVNSQTLRFYSGSYSGGTLDILGASGHIVTTSPSVTLTAAAGAGTGPTITAATTCTDMAGTVSVVAGTLPSSGSVVTVTFATAYASTPKAIILSAANSTTGALGEAYVTSASSAGFTIGVPMTLVATSTYVFSYLVIG